MQVNILTRIYKRLCREFFRTKVALKKGKELNVDNILKKTYRPDTKAGQMMLDISGNDLFNI